MPSVLIVEDDPYVRECLYRRFTAEGWQAREYANPTEALGWAAAHPVDLLLTDVVMPGMKGTELVTKVQSIRPDTRAILISGYPVSYLQRRDYAIGVAPLIQKPFQMKTLLARANAMVPQSS
jgi:DNA-binding NtrC family response regulator